MLPLRWSMVVLLCAFCTMVQAEPKPYRLPAVDLKQRILWGSEATTPEGMKLSFGGMDQDAPDGYARTRITPANGQEQLLAPPKHEPLSGERRSIRESHKEFHEKTVLTRYRYLATTGMPKRGSYIRESYIDDVKYFRRWLQATIDGPYARIASRGLEPGPAAQAKYAASVMMLAHRELNGAEDVSLAVGVHKLHAALPLFEQAADSLGNEPSARALSPLIYDPHTKLFVLFGGDHLDYVMNDLWVFDPKAMRWELRHPPLSPAPRANHKWKVLAGGKLELTGGYRYASNTDYMGGQYIDHDDGPWVYDIAKNEWIGEGKLVASDQREFRTGPFHPDYFLQGDPPDAAAFQKQLKELPANTWVATNPPQRPQMNRDWGTAVMAGSEVILRWAGGHSAHGGTDVLHYHMTTNRWELTRPVEFPLGQLYTNTEYPRGVSFNGQAWITGHTYQSYAYLNKIDDLLFVGQREKTFVYDPEYATWRTHDKPKPDGMNYDSGFYTLTLCAINDGEGVVCWTNEGRIFYWSVAFPDWAEWKLSGKKLPGSSVDNSTLTYDSKRQRLYFFRKPYGDDHRYDGVIHTLDIDTKEVAELKPDGAEAAGKVSYLCQIRYDAANDLLLCGCTLPPGEDGVRRTPAYDPVADRWISLKITGDDPSGPKGRNVSLGLMYDASRQLFWAVDAKSQVFVMRPERSSAEEQLLK